MRISRKAIRDFFRQNNVRGVRLDRDMLWGYYFVDPDRDTLESIIPTLVDRGYRYVEILESSDDSDLHLHLERIETHTAETLYRRCVELDELARDRDVKNYDGFDVGNVDGTNLIDA